jgi:DNA-binding response OmpR family regulator
MGETARLLLIDDDPSFLRSASLVLQSVCEPTTVSDSREFDRLLDRESFGAIITDFRMEHIDGHEIISMAKRRCPEVPVIMVTAYADKDIAIRAANLHVFSILEKPVDADKLRETVLRALEKARPRQREVAPGLTIDANDFSVVSGSQRHRLTELEFRLFESLVSRPGQRVSREELVQRVWGDMRIAKNVLDTHLSNLRRKLPFFKDRLQMIRGKGYIYQ